MLHAKPSLRVFLASMALVCFIVFPAIAAAPPFDFASAIDVAVPAKGALTEGRAPSPASRPARFAPPPVPLGQGFQADVEPNGSAATATPLTGTNLVVRGNLFPATDLDFFSFTATAGDRVYAATMTSFSSGNSTDSQLTLLDQDGVTVLEFDDDSGVMAQLSSVIAGTVIPATGTYFVKVNDFTAATGILKPYELHFRLQSGAPIAEAEPNETPATATPLPANGWVSGTRGTTTDVDFFSFNLNAGDTAYLTLDLDPEDDLTVWNGRLGIALFGDANNQILPVDDAGTSDTGSTPPTTNRPGEAIFMTAKSAGTYFAYVDAAAAVGGAAFTYHLSVSVHPATNEGVNCTTYTSTDVPKAIGPTNSLVSSIITVPGNPRIADLDIEIVLNHVLMTEIDAHLRSPSGNDNGIFTDIGANALAGQAQMDTIFDDEAGVTPFFTALRGIQYKSELAYRLDWYDGENAGGVWTLDLRDDVNNANGGNLTGWSLRICEPPPPPACAPGFVATTVFSTDFESGAAGFTHSGTLDEWELGLPATLATTTGNPPPLAAFNTCNSGVNCWKTDLDGSYELNSSQNLLSPAIDLAGLAAPVVVTWAQRYQMENANFDHYNVNLQQVGGATPVRLFEWLGPTMTNAPGNPAVNLGATAGWGNFSRRADSLAGLNTELLFHVDGDNTVVMSGVAIDDVTVTACRALSADLAITKTDGVTTAVPGGSVTYTITASNGGGDDATGATVADTFPAALTCNWTCVGAVGGTCTAAGAGNINDVVNLPAGGSVTYTANCAISASATGSLSNTAMVSSSVGDPNPANNSATDTDILDVQYDLGITKTDGTGGEIAGTPVTYTITASNAGPSNATGVTVADTFPAALSGCSTTCVGAGGGTCTAGPTAGHINEVLNLPAGGSVIYTATCTIAATATGSLVNTASVSGPDDVNAGNDSATDTDNLTRVADLSIIKTDGATTEIPGTPVTYTMTVSNAGPSATVGAMTDNFPPELSGCSTTCVGAGGATCSAGPLAGNLSDSMFVPPGGTATYTATCNISATATGVLINIGGAAIGGAMDPDTTNNTSRDTDTLTPEADLSITKTDGQTNSTAGQPIVYTIVASNAGASAVTGATVADTFPAGVTGVTWTCAGATGGTCTAAGAGNINQLVNLPVGGSVTYTVSGTIDGGFAGTLTNSATVTAPGSVTDPNPANNSATDSTTVAAAGGAILTGTKTVDGNFVEGGLVTYTIVLTNSGTAAQGDNPGDEFTDPLPSGLTLVSASATSGTTTSAGNIVSWNGALAASAAVTITIEATIDQGASGQIVNQGTINYDTNSDGSNDASGVTDDPTIPGGGNGTGFGVGAPVVEVPTLSEIAMLVFGLALALAGLQLLFVRK